MSCISKVLSNLGKKAQRFELEEKIDDLKDMLSDRGLFPQKKEEKKTHPVVIVLAVIGVIAAVAAIAYAVFYFLIPEDSEYFEDFDDDEYFDDDEDFEDD